MTVFVHGSHIDNKCVITSGTLHWSQKLLTNLSLDMIGNLIRQVFNTSWRNLPKDSDMSDSSVQWLDVVQCYWQNSKRYIIVYSKNISNLSKWTCKEASMMDNSVLSEEEEIYAASTDSIYHHQYSPINVLAYRLVCHGWLMEEFHMVMNVSGILFFFQFSDSFIITMSAEYCHPDQFYYNSITQKGMNISFCMHINYLGDKKKTFSLTFMVPWRFLSGS